MKSADEMLQYAKKSQKADLRQYEKAFVKIEAELKQEETVQFSMVANSAFVNEEWTDSWKPWHLALAVTEERILICGEAVHGRVMTFYDVESFPRKEVRSVELINRKIVIRFEKDVLTIEGHNLDTVAEPLGKALKI